MRPAVIIEKIVLVGLISIIFQQTLPGMQASGIQTAMFIALTIVIVDYLLRGIAARYGRSLPGWIDVPLMAVLDFGIVLAFQLVIPIWRSPNMLMSALVFAALITFFVTLYDLYRPLYDERRDQAAALASTVLFGDHSMSTADGPAPAAHTSALTEESPGFSDAKT
jgi:hypothetical protein